VSGSVRLSRLKVAGRGLRQTRALWKFNCGEERRVSVSSLLCGAQQLPASVEMRVAEKRNEEVRS